MFHIYMGHIRVTENPVSYNYIVSNLFRHAKIEWHKLSALPLGSDYKYLSYVIVRVI